VGVVELLGVIGSKIKEIGQDMMGNTKAMREWHQEMVDANDQLIVHPQNSDRATANYQTLQMEIARLQARKDRPALQKLADNTLMSDANTDDADKSFSKEDEKNLIKYQTMLGELSKDNHEKVSQFNNEERHQQEANQAATLQGLSKIAAERKNAYAEIDRKEKVDQTITPEQASTMRASADAKAKADSVNLERTYSDQVTELRAQAQAAGLEGEQRMYAEMIAAGLKYLTEARRNGENEEQIAAGVAAIELKYTNEVAERKKAFADETHKMEQAAVIAGLEGSARVFAQEQQDIDALSALRRTRGEEDAGYDAAYAQRRVDIEAKANAEIDRNMKQYKRSGQESHDSLGVSTSTGFGQIAAEEQRQKDSALVEYHKMIDGMAADDQRRLEAAQILQGKLDDIEAQGDFKVREMHQRALDETQGIEERAMSVRSGATKEGLAGIFQQEQDATNKVQAEYEKQTRKLQEELDKQEISESDAADRRAAINDQRDAQMAEAQRSSRDKLASTLESTFKDPMGSIRSNMEHEFAEMLANWVMQLKMFKKFFGGSMEGVMPGAGGSALTHSGAAGGAHAASGIMGAFSGRDSAKAAYDAASGIPGGVSTSYSGGGGSSYDSTTAGSGSYGGVATPSSTRGAGGSLTDTISSAATTGYGQYKTLSADYGMMKAGLPKAATAAGSDGLTYRSSADGGSADMINSQDDVDGATSGLGPSGGSASGMSTAAAGVGAAIEAPGAVSGIMGGVEQGGAKSFGTNMLTGAGMGASVGMMFGPEGALIGAGVGAAVGLAASTIGAIFGVSGHIKARKYFHDTLDPKIQGDVQNFRTGGGDFQTAIADINKTAADGMDYATRTFGADAANYMMSTYLRADVNTADAMIAREAKAGMAGLKASAAEFHDGGVIGGFGDLATSDNEGFIHAMRGETVMDRSSSATHAPALSLMRDGATPAEMAAHYMDAMGGGANGNGGGGDTHHHWDISALDAKSFAQMLASGGIQAVIKAQNNFTGQYAGAGKM
jgi:hypothetical protein